MGINTPTDNALMDEAQKSSGYKTKKEIVETASPLLIQVREQANVRSFRGRLNWDGDLGESRTDK